jgi:hypothetical protein
VPGQFLAIEPKGRAIMIGMVFAVHAGFGHKACR